MPKTLPAVGLASGIVQIIDFSSNILSKDHAIYQSENQANEHVCLPDIANNLYWLSSRLDVSEFKKNAEKNSAKLSDAVQQLLKLSEDTKELLTPLLDALSQLQGHPTFDNAVWINTHEALLTVWKIKEITNLQKNLGTARKDVDTALLLALRRHLDQSIDMGIPVLRDESSRAPHWEEWQNEAIDAIRINDWKPKNKKHVEEFSKKVDSLILANNEVRFCNEIFANLHFAEQDDRLYSISTPLERSCRWIFDPKRQREGSFLEWLGSTNGQNLYWITGKPGSGKSTLMKHLFRNERLFPKLEEWSGNSPGILTGFFLWNCGTTLQKTSIGLFRALLYESLQDMIHGPLEEDSSIMQWLFADRWSQFLSYGGGLYSFTLSELRTAFELMVSDSTKKFFFMIDGLDELEDSPTNSLDILVKAAKRENVKVCISSRPSPVFENQPRLEIENWTKKSVLSYILYSFDQNDTMFNIPEENSDGTLERAVVNTIIDKANGVFLWASLAVEFLLQSTNDSDDVSAIWARVEALPPDLDELISYIFDSLDTKDLEQASKLFRLVDASGYPSLLPLCFATDPDTKSGITADTRPLSTTEIFKKVEEMRNLLKFRCKSFVSIFEAIPTENATTEVADLAHFKVNYSHRCIRDFVQSDSMRNRIYIATGYDSLNTDEHWANAHLWTLKTLPQREEKVPIWNVVADCIEHALRLEATTKRVRLTYLDEVAATLNTHLTNIPFSLMDFPPGGTVQSFLDLAVWLNLSSYLSIKAKYSDRKELRHAIEYGREVRKRLGVEREVGWVGGTGRELLRDVYDRVDDSQGVGLLLEYYTKAVKLASPKPTLDMPEWI